MNKLKTFDSSCFIGKSHFEEDGVQNYLVSQSMIRYFKVITITNYISSWKSRGLSAESIKPPITSDNSLIPELNYNGNKVRVKISYAYEKVVDIYIVYELGASTSHDNDPTLKNCLYGAVTLNKNTDVDKCKYSDNWI